jgi:hypothetical protein
VHGAAAAAIGPALTAAIGGLLVVLLLMVSVAMAPSFVAYRVGEPEAVS